jgi:large subunit ribosomal protein L30
MAYLVVRIRGSVNVPESSKATLTHLNLDKKFRATIIPENRHSLGMLRKVKELVAWTSTEPGFVKELLEKKGRKVGPSDWSGEYKSIEELASAISNDKATMSKIHGIKPWFALNPPRGGFKRKTKKQYGEGGILGEDKELMDIARRML